MIFSGNIKQTRYTMTYRKLGKSVLESVLNNVNNITIIEKNAFEFSCGNETCYKNIIYEVVMYIKSGSKLADILKELKAGKFVWNNPAFEEVKFKQQEQDEFIVKPFEVAEGVLKCPKCSECRTFSYSKQTRSADEPMTTFATCMKCKHKWTYSG